MANYPEEAKGFKLLGHDPSAGYGGGSLVEVRKGFAYVAGAGGRGYDGIEGFTAHDVTDPRNPKKVWEFRAPPGVHTHKLRLVGDDLLYVNAERLVDNLDADIRTGLYIFDLSRPAEPRQVGFYDMPGGGPHRFGIDRERNVATVPNEAEGWRERVIWTLGLRDPLRPEMIGIYGLPSQRDEAARPEGRSHPASEATAFHGPGLFRGNRMYAGFWGGGMAVLDCTDLAAMKLIGHISWCPPYHGSTHTVCPVGDRPYLVVTDEAHRAPNFRDSQFMWVVDIRAENNPIPIATYFPDRDKYMPRGRFGAHNILEKVAADGPWKDIVFITYFSAGLRAVDVSDPLVPKEVGHYVPATPDSQKTILSNDIGADEHGRIYVIDRGGAGMHIVEYTG